MRAILVTAAAWAAAAALAQDASTLSEPELYRKWVCAGCHGRERAGTKLAPPLVGVSANWTVDALAAYLVDPKAIVEKNQRLKDQLAMYPATTMPSYDRPEADRKRLAHWLIDQDAKAPAPSPAPAANPE